MAQLRVPGRIVNNPGFNEGLFHEGDLIGGWRTVTTESALTDGTIAANRLVVGMAVRAVDTGKTWFLDDGSDPDPANWEWSSEMLLDRVKVGTLYADVLLPNPDHPGAIGVGGLGLRFGGGAGNLPSINGVAFSEGSYFTPEGVTVGYSGSLLLRSNANPAGTKVGEAWLKLVSNVGADFKTGWARLLTTKDGNAIPIVEAEDDLPDGGAVGSLGVVAPPDTGGGPGRPFDNFPTLYTRASFFGSTGWTPGLRTQFLIANGISGDGSGAIEGFDAVSVNWLSGSRIVLRGAINGSAINVSGLPVVDFDTTANPSVTSAVVFGAANPFVAGTYYDTWLRSSKLFMLDAASGNVPVPIARINSDDGSIELGDDKDGYDFRFLNRAKFDGGIDVRSVLASFVASEAFALINRQIVGYSSQPAISWDAGYVPGTTPPTAMVFGYAGYPTWISSTIKLLNYSQSGILQTAADGTVSTSALVSTIISPSYQYRNGLTTHSFVGANGTGAFLGNSSLDLEVRSPLWVSSFAGGGIVHAAPGSGQLTCSAIVNADVASNAAIAGTKVSPDFGPQAIASTSTISLNTGALPSIGVIRIGAGAGGTPTFLAFKNDSNQDTIALSSPFGGSVRVGDKVRSDGVYLACSGNGGNGVYIEMASPVLNMGDGVGPGHGLAQSGVIRFANTAATLIATRAPSGAAADIDVLSTTPADVVRLNGGVVQAKGGTLLGFFGATPVAKPVVSGSRGGNVALASLLTALQSLGLITDSTTS